MNSILQIWILNDETLYNDCKGLSVNELKEYFTDVLLDGLQHGLKFDIINHAIADVDWDDVYNTLRD